MSGAEPLAAMGLASNVLQFVDFTSKLCAQIKEYASSVSGLPKELSQQAVQLSALLDLLKELSQQPNGPEPGKVVLGRCQIQAQELSDLLESLQGGRGQSRWKTVKVAVKSLKRTQQIDRVRYKPAFFRLASIAGFSIFIADINKCSCNRILTDLCKFSASICRFGQGPKYHISNLGSSAYWKGSKTPAVPKEHLQEMVTSPNQCGSFHWAATPNLWGGKNSWKTSRIVS